MGATKTRQCPAGHRYDVLDHRGVVTVLEKEGDACFELTCPTCGAAEFTEHLLGVGEEYVPHGAGYPYFDHGLGVELESAEHRRRVMRERGVVCMEGEAGREFDRIMGERRAAEAREGERRRQDAERQAADPEIRRAQTRVADAMAGSATIEEFVEKVYGSRAGRVLGEVS